MDKDQITITRSTIEKIEALPTQEEYVYDIVMEDEEYPYFIANGILVHNSIFFSLADYAKQFPVDQVPKAVIEKADEIAKLVNENFIKFMQKTFLCTDGYDSLVRGNREVVSTNMIIQAKKKYVMNVIDIEGVSITEDNPKSIKTMGSDIKMTSTPKAIRNFIKDVTLDILREKKSKQQIEADIIKFRKNISKSEDYNPLDFASISSVNEYDKYYSAYTVLEKRGNGKARLPGNVRAAINHNEMLSYFKDLETQPLKSGDKIKIIWLKPNQFNIVSMGFLSDSDDLPDWFKEHFEIDLKTTEQKLIDNKLKNIFDAIEWEVPTLKTIKKNLLFTF
jgi:hypothetical protein